MYVLRVMYFFFFFKQKTAYEMRISDWSSDVCSSDLFAQFAQRTEPVDMDMVSRIRQEAFHHSQVMQTLAELTEDVGPRLTNSPNMDKANDWANAKLSGWGLVNVHDDAFADFGRGWELSQAKVELLAPRALPLFALPTAGTPGTDGSVAGEAIATELKRKADIDKNKGKLRRMTVILDPVRDEQPGTTPYLTKTCR